MSFFTSVEFYVLALFFAAAIVAYMARPRHIGAARQYLLAGELEMVPAATEPAIDLRVNDDGSVTLTRTGLFDVNEKGAASLAVEVIGFDIEIKERLTVVGDPAWPVNTATFRLDFLAPERYHLHYSNPSLDLAAATTLSVKPGIHIYKRLS